MVLGGTGPGGKNGGKNGKGGAGAGKAGGAAGKAAANRAGSGGLGGKSGGMGSKSGGMGSKSSGMGSKSGGGGGFGSKQSSSSAKPGGLGGNKSSGFGSKPGSSSKPGGLLGSKSSGSAAAKPGGFGAKTPAKPGSAAKPGGLIGKPAASASKPGGLGAAKPGSSAAKPGGMGAAKPGGSGPAKPGGMGAGAKPGAAGAKPGSALGAKPGTAAASKPGGLGSKPGSSGALGAKPSTSAGKLGGGIAKSGGLGGAAKTGGLGTAAKAGGLGAGGLGAGAKGVGAASVQSTVRTAVALKTAHDVTRGMAPNKNGQDERDEKLPRNSSTNSGLGDTGGNSRNIALSQMDRLDITKMSPRELMMLERQYGSGWLKTLAPTQFNRIQNAVGGAALTSNTPTALSSHMDPRLLQAASGIQGTGLMGVPQDSDVPMDGQETPVSADPTKFDAAALATHPEQIGEGEMEEGEEERIPSDPMKVKLIDAPVDQVDGNPAPLPQPTPSLALPPQLTLPQASSAPPPEDSSEAPSSPGPMSPGTVPQLGAPPPQTTPMGAPPPQASQLGTHPPPVSQMSAPAYSYESYDSSPYGENLYNQQPGYDPLQMQDQYHMSAPLLDSGNPDHMAYYPQPFPSRYPQNHKSYYHFSQMNNPDRYNFTKAVQNYDRASHNDGMYCYSCIMFFGVLMIGCGIIMIIVELFDLFGKHKNMPLAIAGGGVLALGIIILAGSMLLWRRRRSNIKKKAAHV